MQAGKVCQKSVKDEFHFQVTKSFSWSWLVQAVKKVRCSFTILRIKH